MENLFRFGILLSQVARNGGAAPLIRAGLQYSQIAQLIADAREEGLIAEDELKLTRAGEELLSRFQSVRQRAGVSGWIAAADAYRVAALPVDTPYVPRKAPS